MAAEQALAIGKPTVTRVASGGVADGISQTKLVPNGLRGLLLLNLTILLETLRLLPATGGRGGMKIYQGTISMGRISEGGNVAGSMNPETCWYVLLGFGWFLFISWWALDGSGYFLVGFGWFVMFAGGLWMFPGISWRALDGRCYFLMGSGSTCI